MKKLILLILLIPSILFAGPLQQAHKKVIAGQTVASGAAFEIKYETYYLTQDNIGNGGITVTIPSTVEDGNLLILDHHDDINITPDALTGWTQITISASSSAKLTQWYRIADSDASEEYTINTSSNTTTRAKIAAVTVYSKTGGTWSVSGSNNFNNDASSLANTAIDVATNGLLHCAYTHDSGEPVTGSPSGMEEIYDVTQGTTLTGSANYQIYTTSASSETKTTTWGASDQVHANAVSVELE